MSHYRYWVSSDVQQNGVQANAAEAGWLLLSVYVVRDTIHIHIILGSRDSLVPRSVDSNAWLHCSALLPTRYAAKAHSGVRKPFHSHTAD